MQKNLYKQACITRKYMGYLVKYCIQKFLIYSAMQVLESNKGIKGLQACIKICATFRGQRLKSQNNLSLNKRKLSTVLVDCT